MKTVAAEHFLRVQCELGECPVWDHRRNTLFMVDIIRCRLIGFDWASQRLSEWPLPALGGGLALAEGNRLIAATQRGIFLFDAADGSYSFLAHPEPEAWVNRYNEGKCDAAGRFWIGSMPTIDRRASGQLMVVGKQGQYSTVLKDIVIPNTLTWTSDNREMIFADSWKKTVWRFPFDLELGQLGERKVWLDLTASPGIPDGIAGDAAGGYWIARFSEGRVVRHDASGAETHQIFLPTTQITSCAFCGPELDKLVIVSAKRLLNDTQRESQPQAGDLFIADAPYPGVRSHQYI